MSELQIAWLELGTVGGLGAIFVLTGIMIGALTKKKNNSCKNGTNCKSASTCGTDMAD